MFKRPKLSLGFIAGVLGFALFGQGFYMGGKALLAQSLMESAWQKIAASGDVHMPWSWMDAHPVARLSIAGDDRSHIVLNTDSGQALAFGPAIIQGTEDTDMLAIAAHKNTQFQYLEHVKLGDIIRLERPEGEVLEYRVSYMNILDSRVQGISIADSAETPSRLALVTCYPFDAISFNGPMRYVVYAKRIETLGDS